MSEPIEISNVTLESIKKYFKFLFDRGYDIYSGKTFNVQFDAWEAVLKNQDFFLKFEEERGGLDLSFGSPSKGFVRIRALIYFLSKEKKFIGLGGSFFDFFKIGMEKEAKLLQQYIDQFESSFGTEFPATKEEAELANDKYYKRLTG
jgi:hypothetical protein